MCGINGISWKDSSLVKKMNEKIRHRGPDAEGVKEHKGITLGHVRLAIIDLDKRANQPFVYEHKHKRIVITYNGEVYNYKEIKKQ